MTPDSKIPGAMAACRPCAVVELSEEFHYQPPSPGALSREGEREIVPLRLGVVVDALWEVELSEELKVCLWYGKDSYAPGFQRSGFRVPWPLVGHARWWNYRKNSIISPPHPTPSLLKRGKGGEHKRLNKKQ